MLDEQLMFSDEQAITLNATTGYSTNLVDLGVLYDHKGVALLSDGPENSDTRLIVTVAVAPTAGTGLQVELVDCATEGGTYKPTGIGVNAAIPISTLVAGYEILNVPLQRGLMRYCKILYTTTGDHGASAGKINAYLAPGVTTRNQTPYRA
jgi:hypothetical protein